MKRIPLVFFFLLTLIFHSWGAGTKSEASPELKIYCSASFASEWGPGPIIAEGFESQTGYRIEYTALGNMGMVLNRLILEKEAPIADLVIGLNDGMLSRVKKEEVLEPYTGNSLASIAPELLFDPDLHLIPYDYGHYAILYDSEFITDPPKNLEDLTHSRFEDSLVLMDPRSSATGLGFLLWTISVYGEEWKGYWKKLRPSILTVTDGWSQGYALFTAGEAPLVLSYATSPVYHAAYENSQRYVAAPFPEGHYQQIEGVGIVAGSDEAEAARDFIDYMLSQEIQEVIAMTNIMLPVNLEVPLPEVFQAALIPEKVLSLDPFYQEKNLEQWQTDWTRQFQE